MNHAGSIIPAEERRILLMQAKQGDPEALNNLFKCCRGSLYRRALRILSKPQDAEDAVQEAMVAAFRQLHRFEGRSDFLTWTTRIVINAALQQIRRGHTRATISLDRIGNESDGSSLNELLRDPRPTPEEELQAAEHANILKRAMQRLPGERRRIIQLCHSKDYSLRETANALGLRPCTLKARLHRGRQALAAQLKREVRDGPRRLLHKSSA